MAGAVDISGSTIPSVLEEASARSHAGMLGVAELTPDPEDGTKKDLAVSRYISELKVYPKPVDEKASRLPALFQDPTTLSAAFSQALRDARFNMLLEEVAADLGNVTEAEDYLVRWSSFMSAFLERAFVVRALLEAADSSDNTEFDRAAVGEIKKIDKMMEWAHGAFHRYIKEPIRGSWSYDFVRIQLDKISQPINLVTCYPRLLDSYDGERLKGWRKKAIDELARITDPLSYMRGMETSEVYENSLRIDLPQEKIDFFVAHPDGDRINLEAVKRNAEAFFFLRSALSEIGLEAGRNASKETHISIEYSKRMGAFLIRDRKPMVFGTLYPFATEPPRSRLYSIVDRMGTGSALRMKGPLENRSVSTIVIQVADILAPDRQITFTEAAEAKVATRRESAKDDKARIDSSSEDSGVNPMASVFKKPPEVVQDETSFAGVMVSPKAEIPSSPIEDIFAEIAVETSGLAPASINAGSVAKLSAGIAAGTVPITLVK